MVSMRGSLFVFATLFAIALARPGANTYPSDDENTIPDYAYDTEEDAKADPAYVGGWKSVPVSNPDKLYDDVKSEDRSEENPSANPAPAEPTAAVAPEAVTPEAVTPEAVAPEVKASEVVDVVRAADAAGSAGAVGAVAAVQAVEAVKAALETTAGPESTTTFPATTVAASGRSLDDNDRAQDDAPNTEQNLYGFSRFLHDLLQVPVQVMRSVSSYLTSAFNAAQDSPNESVSTPEQRAALTSAMLSQSF